jgi:SAM-dependent methyltransferase
MVVDVGAGAGRFALGLAPRVSTVTAVDPSAGMLRQLRRRARALGVGNIRCVRGRWEDVDVRPADFAFSAYVLPLVEDAVPFLERLDASARRSAAVVLSAVSGDAVWDVLWRHFHGGPRSPGPTWLDAVALLRELGMDPEVEVVEPSYRARYTTMREAVDDVVPLLALADTSKVRAELQQVLEAWLVRRGGGLAPPVRTLPAAVVSWQPRGTADRGSPHTAPPGERKAHDE